MAGRKSSRRKKNSKLSAAEHARLLDNQNRFVSDLRRANERIIDLAPMKEAARRAKQIIFWPASSSPKFPGLCFSAQDARELCAAFREAHPESHSYPFPEFSDGERYYIEMQGPMAETA